MKLLAKCSYGYHMIDPSQQSVTKYLNDEKSHAANNSNLFKRLNHENKALYEVELDKAEIEHKEPINVTLQYVTLRILELNYIFFAKYCDVKKFEDLEMDKTSQYFARAEKELEECVWPEMKAEWKRLRLKDCTDNHTAEAVGSFFPQMCCEKDKKYDKREPGLFKEEFRCIEKLCFCSKTYCCNDVTTVKYEFTSKSLNKRVLEQIGEGRLEKFTAS